jgi:hypothetical protein
LLLAELRLLLVRAVESGLGNVVLFRRADSDFTVSQVAEALEEPGLPIAKPDDAIARLLERQAEIRRRLETVESLRANSISVEKVIAELEQLRARLPESGELEKAAAQARQQRTLTSNQLRETGIALGRVQRAGLDPDELLNAQNELAESIKGLEVDEIDLTKLFADLAAEVRSLEIEETAENAALSEADRELVVISLERSRLYVEARDTAASPVLSELLKDDLEPTWQRAAQIASATYDSIATLIDNVQRLQFVGHSGGSEDEWGDAIIDSIEELVRGDFSDPAISRALFEGGDLVDVDFRKQTLTWESAEGQRRVRPASAFSSGQQAFGFVRARLLQVAAEPATNRIVFLDEFGAFVSADMRGELAALLSDDELNRLAGQVVVVLPLQSDYQAELESTTGTLRDLYEHRSVQLAESGYFAEEFRR